jgi:hypothetical protein
MRYTIQRTYELLEENGHKEADFVDLHNKVIQKLEDRMMVVAKEPFTKKKQKQPVIDFVCKAQSNMPWKLITLQKIDNDGVENLRFCYYTLNFKLLNNEGKLRIIYGQFGLNIPMEDYNKLIEKAKEKGMI